MNYAQLNLSLLEQELSKQGVSVLLFNTLSSTNDYLKQNKPNLCLCIAEQQSSGRGRLGKAWASPPGVNLYFSLLWPVNKKAIDLSGLSLMIALSIVTVLHSLGLEEHLKIKWPNDIYWQQQKLAGVLVEIDTNHCPIIGIGLNVNMLDLSQAGLIKPWTSIAKILNQQIDRNLLLISLVKQLLSDLTQFEKSGLQPFLATWSTWDFLRDKEITLKFAYHAIHGIVRGINQQGYLLLQDVSGQVKAYSSGEASVLL